MTKSLMRNYEMVLIFKTEGWEKIKDKVAKTITGLKGKILKEKSWGERELVYPIKKETKGNYFFLDLSLDPTKINELDRSLRLKEEILRFLIIKDTDK